MDMKRIALSLIIAIAGLTAGAQEIQLHTSPEDNNRDANGKIQRSSYITNEWYDNWELGVSGGVQTMISGYADKQNTGFDIGTGVLTPSFDFTLTKWITPGAAVRFGLQGFNVTENRELYMGGWWNHYVPKQENGRMYYGQTYMHCDVMLSVTNFVWGYKESRFYNFTPYFHTGYLRLYHPDEGIFTKTHRDREIELGFGVLNTFRVTDHVGVNVDLRWGNFAGRFHDVSNGGRVNDISLMAGMRYTMFKWYWNRFSTAAKGYENAIAAEKALRAANERKLAAAQKDLEAAQKMLEDQKAELAQRLLAEQANIDKLGDTYINPDGGEISSKDTVILKDELLVRLANAEFVLFYPINVDRLSAQEEYRLDAYIRQVRETDSNHVFYLTGSADKGTGNERINTRLSRNRAENVKRLLMKKYGIPESQIVIKAMIITDKHADGSLDRCTLFENQ